MIQPNAQVCRRLAGASLECATPLRGSPRPAARLVAPPPHCPPPLPTLAAFPPSPPSARRPTTHRFTTTNRDTRSRPRIASDGTDSFATSPAHSRGPEQLFPFDLFFIAFNPMDGYMFCTLARMILRKEGEEEREREKELDL